MNFETILSFKNEWESIQNNIINIKNINQSFINENEKQIKDSKKELSDLTKKLRMKDGETLQKSECVDLLEKYNKELDLIKELNSQIENQISNIFKSIATISSPFDVITLSVNIIKSIPNYSSEIDMLKEKINDEKKKTEKVYKLRDIREQLKLDCDEQVRLAEKAAESQVHVDFDVQIAELMEQLRISENQIRDAKQQFNTLNESINKLLKTFNEKQNTNVKSSSIRQEQIEILDNELDDDKMILQELESVNNDQKKREEIMNLKNKIHSNYEEKDNIQNRYQLLKQEISQKKQNIINQQKNINENIQQLQQQINDNEMLLDQLPTPLQWNQMQKQILLIDDSLKIHNQQINFKNDLNILSNKRNILEKENISLTSLLQKDKAEDRNIINEIKNLISNNERSKPLIENFKNQQLDLQNKIQFLTNDIKSKELQNNSIQRDNLILEKELQTLSKNIPSDQYHQTLHKDKNKEKVVIYKGKNLTEQFLLKLSESRSFRIFIIVYFILLHFVIFIITIMRVF